MIKIFNETIRLQKNFWNGCVFHPTDAVEDPWGKRILDQMSADDAVKRIRIYTMFEDIVYVGADGELQFDFRINDLRLDYLVEKGYDLFLAYGGMPDCIARDCVSKSTAAKGKTRYKGKMWNTSPPKTAEIWEEVCYQYTKHIVERYGVERVSKWYCHCFNEPDTSLFFMGTLHWTDFEPRVLEYYSMYKAFVNGIRRVSKEIPVGGPALANREDFLEMFLRCVKAEKTELNFISLHYYGADPFGLNEGTVEFGVLNILDKHRAKLQIIEKCGFGNIPILIDEWGAASHGFLNKEECPMLMFRETEKYSAYYTCLIYDIIHSEFEVQELMICLSGQHEMTEDFSGFRNFFTLNFIQKPIYNTYILASKLGENLVKAEWTDTNVSVIPTKNEKGSYVVLLCYATKNFSDKLADKKETLVFEEDICDKIVTVWVIDKEHTNPYRLYQKMGWTDLSQEQIKILKEEGKLKPISKTTGKSNIELSLSANSTFLITIE